MPPPRSAGAPVTAARIADAAARRRVLVVGSPPPGGRDLDLLARPEEEEAVAAALEAGGFLRRGNTWARFAGGTADVVDLIPAAEWGREELFDEAVALEGYDHLVVPAAHHELLLAAARFITPAGRMKEGRTRRVAAAARDPSAVRRARAAAGAWGAERDLERVEALIDGVPRRDWRATVRALPARARRRPGAVVALSGTDDAARRRQAQALAEALDRLGHAPVVVRGGTGLRDAAGAARHRAAGRVAVFDGFVLDAVVRGRPGVRRHLVRALSPRPAAAVLLDAGAGPSARRYREEAARLGVPAVDATAPPDELAARIAELVWRVLD